MLIETAIVGFVAHPIVDAVATGVTALGSGAVYIIVRLTRENRDLKRQTEEERSNAAEARQETEQARQETEQVRQETEQVRQEKTQAEQREAQARQETEQARQEKTQAEQREAQARQEATQARQDALEARQEKTEAKEHAEWLSANNAELKDTLDTERQNFRIKEAAYKTIIEALQTVQQIAPTLTQDPAQNQVLLKAMVKRLLTQVFQEIIPGLQDVFVDTVSFDFLSDPYVLPSGHSLNRETIIKLYEEASRRNEAPRCPMTRQRLPENLADLPRNVALVKLQDVLRHHDLLTVVETAVTCDEARLAEAPRAANLLAPGTGLFSQNAHASAAAESSASVASLQQGR